MFAAFCYLVSLIAKNALAEVLQAINTSRSQGKILCLFAIISSGWLYKKELLKQSQLLFLVQCFSILFPVLSSLHICLHRVIGQSFQWCCVFDVGLFCPSKVKGTLWLSSLNVSSNTNSIPPAFFVRELNMATTLQNSLPWLNINAMFCFCLAGFTWRYSHNRLKEKHCSFPNRLKKTPILVCVSKSCKTCGLLWLVLHLSGYKENVGHAEKESKDKIFSSTAVVSTSCATVKLLKTGEREAESGGRVREGH